MTTHKFPLHNIWSEKEDEQNFDYKKESPKNAEENKVSGVVTGADHGTADTGVENEESKEEENIPNTFSNSWKLNLVLAVVSCWFSMALTAWGSIQSGGDAANPQVGQVSMWVIVGSQWIALSLYLWTLVAPRFFPERDFSWHMCSTACTLNTIVWNSWDYHTTSVVRDGLLPHDCYLLFRDSLPLHTFLLCLWLWSSPNCICRWMLFLTSRCLCVFEMTTKQDSCLSSFST